MCETIPIEHKLNLTIKEASKYSGLDETIIKELTLESKCDFVLHINKTKVLIKRPLFDIYLNKLFFVYPNAKNMASKESWKVYAHISPDNKIYIGYSSDVYQRWKDGSHNYRNSPPFYHDILKFQWNNFKHKILAIYGNRELALRQESLLILYYNYINNNNTYNILGESIYTEDIYSYKKIITKSDNDGDITAIFISQTELLELENINKDTMEWMVERGKTYQIIDNPLYKKKSITPSFVSIDLSNYEKPIDYSFSNVDALYERGNRRK